MSNLPNLQPVWHDDINMLDTNEAALGGPEGGINLAPRQLAESLLWMKQQLGSLESIKVGDLYNTTIAHANAAAVATHHGYGTWERYGEGRVLAGFSTNASDPSDYKSMGAEFGENTHKLTVDEMPSHKHGYGLSSNITGSGYPATDNADNNPGSNQTESTGGSQPHNNIQPVVVVGRWIRTA